MKRDGRIDKSENGWPSTIEVKDSPYLSPGLKDDTSGKSSPSDELADLAPAIEAPHRGRKFILAGIAMIGIICSLLVYYAFYRDRRRLDYTIIEKRNERRALPIIPDSGVDEEKTDQITAEAINQAKEELRRPTVDPVKPSTPPQVKAQIAEPQPTIPAFSTTPIEERPIQAAVPAVTAEAGKIDGNSTQSPAGVKVQPDRHAQPSRQQSNPAASHSVYVTETDQTKAISGSRQSRIEPGPTSPETHISNSGDPKVALPDFGAMLPARTLGKVYTLRSSALVRLEATRDVEGDGWAIKRGTILVGQQHGGEVDRAYVTLVGFIDPASNRLVKMSGDVLGDDGAPGLKGRRRQVSSRWGRIFSRASAGALLLGQAALSRGGATVILPGSSGIGGIGSDFGISNSTLTHREFVEIPANATAYVLVTGLPKETQKTAAEPIAQAAETLTDDELAELLSSGTPEQIREALPRMTVEMRKLALLVLGEKVQ